MVEAIEPRMKSQQELLNEYQEAIQPLLEYLGKILSLYSPVYIIEKGEIVSIERTAPPPEIQEMIDKVHEMMELVRKDMFSEKNTYCASFPLCHPENRCTDSSVT